MNNRPQRRHGADARPLPLCLRFVSTLTLALMLLLAPLNAQTREIVDMSGRTVTIPDTVTKVAAVSPPGTYLLYAIDPTLLAGLNFPLWDSEKKYTDRKSTRLNSSHT